MIRTQRPGSSIVPRGMALLLAVAFLPGCQALGGSATSTASAADAESEGTSPAAREHAAEMEQALGVLRDMSAFIASQSSLSFAADIAYEAVQLSGQKIEFGSRRTVTLRRPDRVRVEVLHWRGEEELLTFDGGRLSLAIPNQNVYASTEYRGTTAEAFEELITRHGVASPLTDLMRPDVADDVAARAESGRHLGSVTVGGVRCEHLAFQGERVDFQLFVVEGDEPAPARLVIDYHAEPGRPQFRARFGPFDWAPELSDDQFRYRPNAGAQRVPFEEVIDVLLGPLEPPLEEEAP